VLSHRRPTTRDALGPLADLLAAHDLTDIAEVAFPNDGWSGSRLTALDAPDGRYVLKRTSWETDWIVRATDDRTLREGWVAAGAVDVPSPPRAIVDPYLGVAADAGGIAILMRDLSEQLFEWQGAPIPAPDLDRVLASVGTLHAARWWPTEPGPWCRLDRRLTLLGPAAAVRYRDEGLAVGPRFLDGWAAFDRRAPDAARDLVARLDADVGPLVRALARLPALGLHGDLKLANVALVPDGGISLIDWQMATRGPVAVELGWLLVSNVAQLPEPPEAVLARYLAAGPVPGSVVGDWELQLDLTWIVGLLLRGWRKGLDAEDGVATGWGASGSDDLAWWCDRAVEAADRRL
jgi:hypothetical protein